MALAPVHFHANQKNNNNEKKNPPWDWLPNSKACSLEG